MKKILLLLITFVSLVNHAAQISFLKVTDQGILRFNNGYIITEYKGQRWISSNNKRLVIDKGYPKEGADSWQTGGIWEVKTGEILSLKQEITKLSDSQYLYNVDVSSKETFSPKELSLTIVMKARHFINRELTVDNKNIILPEKFSKIRIFSRKKAKTLLIPISTGILSFTGDLNLIIQDNRRWKLDDYSLRIRFNPSKGEMKKSNLNLKIGFIPYSTSSIDISKQTNMAFKDEVPGDQKGGWTDQGSNDLSMIKPGKKKLMGVNFDIIDPAQNGGKSCMVFKGKARPYLLDQAVVDGKNASYKAIYLLHASAWRAEDGARIGSIKVKYTDDTEDLIEILSKRDVDDWFNGDNKVNARNVWAGRNKRSTVFLYLSKFKISDKPIDKFIFNSDNKAVWMLVSMSGGDDIPLQKLFPSAIVTGEEWSPIKNDLYIKPGSALDFSKISVKEKPAGKYGFIVEKNGQFEFENKPGVRQRFYGVNIIPPYYPDFKHIDKMAEYVSSMGYNSARLHHYDKYVVDKSDPRCVRLDEKGIKQFDYVFYKLREQGLYISTDLYSLRTIKAGAIKNIKGSLSCTEFKALVALYPEAWENWKEFATNVMEHKNYYTGIKLKNDPALFSICLVNEDNIHHCYSLCRAKYKKMFKEAYKKSGYKKDFGAYLSHLGIEFYKKSSNYLKSIGVKALLTSANANIPGMAKDREFQAIRNTYDYVDNHSYWDHGKYNRKTQRWETRNTCSLTEKAATPRGIMQTRIFGKPFMITELNFCYPNHYRAEGGPLTGAYCSLQDYDGIFRFNLAHFPKRYYISHFDIALDPIAVLSEKIAILFFLRRDVSKGQNKIPLVFNINRGEFPKDYNTLGLVSQIGGLYSGSKLPASSLFYTGVKDKLYKNKFIPATDDIIDIALKENMIKRSNINVKSETYVSDTNQIILSAKEGRFSVITPKSECFILKEGQSARGNSVCVNNKLGRSVVFAGALDKETIEKSRSLLIMHLTDAQNSGAIYTDKFHTSPVRKGHLPAVIRTGEAEIAISNGMNNPQIWALDLSGKRIAAIPFKRVEGKLIIKLKTIHTGISQPILAYEITNKE